MQISGTRALSPAACCFCNVAFHHNDAAEGNGAANGSPDKRRSFFTAVTASEHTRQISSCRSSDSGSSPAIASATTCGSLSHDLIVAAIFSCAILLASCLDEPYELCPRSSQHRTNTWSLDFDNAGDLIMAKTFNIGQPEKFTLPWLHLLQYFLHILHCLD